MVKLQHNLEAFSAASSPRLGAARSIFASLLIGVVAVCSPVAVYGVDYTWNGSVDNSYLDADNWDTAIAPPTINSGATQATLIFDVETGTPDYTVVLDKSNNGDLVPVGLLHFKADAGAYTFDPDTTEALLIRGMDTGLPDGDFVGILNESSNLITFNAAIESAAQGNSSGMERLVFDAGTGGLTFNESVSFTDNAKDLLIQGDSDVNINATITSVDNTTGSLVKLGVKLANDHTLEVAGTIDDMGAITLIEGKILLSYVGSDIINDTVGNKATGLEMQGGTLLFADSGDQTAIFNETLTLTADSTIDLGDGGSVDLRFDDAGGATWTANTRLNIENWDGTLADGNGNDQVYFGTDNTADALTATQLSQIRFVNPNGLAAGTYLATWATDLDGEIVPGALAPVPEPRAVAASIGLALLIGWRERKRLKGWLRFA